MFVIVLLPHRGQRETGRPYHLGSEDRGRSLLPIGLWKNSSPLNSSSLTMDTTLHAPLARTSSLMGTRPRNGLRGKPAPVAEGHASSTSTFGFPRITNGKFLDLDHAGDSQSIDARPDQGQDERG